MRDLSVQESPTALSSLTKTLISNIIRTPRRQARESSSTDSAPKLVNNSNTMGFSSLLHH